MRIIFKYPICIGRNTLSLPKGSKILHVAEQRGQLCMWIEQDTTKPQVYRNFQVYGTGKSFGSDRAVEPTFVGTALVNDFVWHVYELK